MQTGTLKMVIALGGNAITLPTEEGNVGQQFAHTRETMRLVADVITAGHQVILTHGNGPQVGNILRRSEVAAEQHVVYPIPLELCVADTQGGMGYMISQCLENELLSRGLDRKCATVITTVLVDQADPEFAQSTKPIGVFYREDEARRHIELGWKMVEIPKRGWRRVVPSPVPLEIVEINLIRRLTDAGDLVVCCGGGGIPVARQADGGLRGVEAVIDKDRTAALLAAALGADLLVILTSVPQVCLYYGTDREQPVASLDVAQARELLAAGHFPAGSMGPKIQAAIDFLERASEASMTEPATSGGLNGRAVLITDQTSLPDALAGRAGTRIVRN